MRLTSNVSKATMKYRRESGLSYHIHCTGRTKFKGRAEAWKEYKHWKSTLLPDMYTELKACGYHDDAVQLRKDVSFREQMNGYFVIVHPDSYHIFTYALRNVDPNAYKRNNLREHRSANMTGWW